MKKYLTLLIFLLIFHSTNAQNEYVLVIHGGAGNILVEQMDRVQIEEYNLKLKEALAAGESILATGGKSLDAVIAAVRVLEDSPLFNAGKGAVYNAEGKHELDASIMDGQTGKAGAVAGTSTIKNPILAARLAMDSSAHVLLSGKGADQFAKSHGLEMVENSYFDSDKAEKEYKRIKEKLDTEGRKGTVGAVALDIHGNLAAATSTGGMTFKQWGRIGDSPIIGAGTYANNQTCAVSCTGHGEYFIRNSVAYDVSARMLYLKETVDQAANFIINSKLVEQGGTGGLIAVDKDGNISMPFNTKGMFRGYIKQGQKAEVLISK
ncbi:MAG TPA: isoaspartyl peptidase/L-asparaginase [Lentimicrobium sp.]|nr:isoaspartyl peptidase/L-asparaginase [Lentimicrobium sp.]